MFHICWDLTPHQYSSAPYLLRSHTRSVQKCTVEVSHPINAAMLRICWGLTPHQYCNALLRSHTPSVQQCSISVEVSYPINTARLHICWGLKSHQYSNFYLLRFHLRPVAWVSTAVLHFYWGLIDLPSNALCLLRSHFFSTANEASSHYSGQHSSAEVSPLRLHLTSKATLDLSVDVSPQQ